MEFESPTIKSYFAEQSESVQEQINELVNQLYEPDDGTPLQELATRAYLLGCATIKS